MKIPTTTRLVGGAMVLLMVAAAAVVALPRRPRGDAYARAVDRLVNADNPGFVLRRGQLAFLAHADALISSREFHDALQQVGMGFARPESLRDQLNHLTEQLAPYQQHHEEPSDSTESRSKDPLLDPVVARLTGNRGPSFIHIVPADPREILAGMDREDGDGDTPSSPDKDQEIRESTKETHAPDGTTKTVTTRYDAEGRVVSRNTFVTHADHSFEHSYEVRGGDLWYRHDVFSSPGRWEEKSFWRQQADNVWRRATPPIDIGGYPTDEGGRSTRTIHYVLRLNDGTLMGCTILNPFSGVAACSPVGANRVNPGPEPRSRPPVVDAARLDFDPRDYVTDPDPDNPRPRPEPATGTPPSDHRTGPGANPGPPNHI